jgi:glycosyltransferase involved in cell wall biosynthesis
MGIAHPNPMFTEYSMSDNAILLAEELGVRDKHVFFNESWVPFEERANFLLDANVGVSTHYVHLETAFSFRTRLLDYLWAGLPIIATEGDTFAPIIEHYHLGLVVDESDVQSCAEAIITMIENPQLLEKYSYNVSRIRERFRWSKVAQPLLTFVGKGEHAADFQRPIGQIPHHVKRDYWITGKFRGLKIAFDEGGFKLVIRKLGRKA